MAHRSNMSALPSDDRHYEPTPAELMATEAHSWVRGTSRRYTDFEGRPLAFYLVPSRTEVDPVTKLPRVYYTNSRGCNCKGYRHRGRCTHVEAVRLYESEPAYWAGFTQEAC